MNDDFAIKCSSCSSYIQDRVPNLDFYSMVWMIVESPGAAFKKIIIAEHKNFVLFLSLFLGISCIFALLSITHSGRAFDNLLTLLLFGGAVGFVSALPILAMFTGVLYGIAKLFRGNGSFASTYAVAGWSLVPVMFSTVFLLPLELGTLGLLLFSDNPSAYEVKPVVTMVLLGLNGLAFIWTLLLAAKGVSMAHRVHYLIGLVIVSASVSAVSGFAYFIFLSFNI